MEKMSKIMDIMGTRSAQELKHLCDLKSTCIRPGPSSSYLAQNRQDTTIYPYY